VTLAACGVMVERALSAAGILEGEGISAEVIDVMSVKPLDEDTLLASAGKTGAVVTCEEHELAGGMGSAIAEVLGERLPTKMARVGIRDTFGTSGEPEELMAHYGLTAADVARAARRLVESR